MRVAGTPVAVRNRCPHRSFPLAMGRLEGDTLVCGYHGARFGCDGVCSGVPSQSVVPPGARTRAFPVAQHGPLVWIWMGDAALADPSTHDEVRADHQRVIDAGGFGVPTLFFGDQCLFGPVLIDPPTGPAALRLWDVVSGMAELPHVYELQRPKTAADAALIGRSLKPYIDGRDWVSINRGEVIDLEKLGDATPT